MGMEFNAPRRILTGEGCLADAEKYFCSMGKKAFIVTGKHVKKLECFTQVMGFLDKNGIQYTVYSGITGEPDDKMIDEGVKLYKREKCDFLIAVGVVSFLVSKDASYVTGQVIEISGGLSM